MVGQTYQAPWGERVREFADGRYVEDPDQHMPDMEYSVYEARAGGRLIRLAGRGDPDTGWTVADLAPVPEPIEVIVSRAVRAALEAV